MRYQWLSYKFNKPMFVGFQIVNFKVISHFKFSKGTRKGQAKFVGIPRIKIIQYGDTIYLGRMSKSVLK